MLDKDGVIAVQKDRIEKLFVELEKTVDHYNEKYGLTINEQAFLNMRQKIKKLE